MVLGTPAFMAPEQVGGDGDVGDRADVYAVGLILFRLLTRARAVRGVVAARDDDAPRDRRRPTCAPSTPSLPEPLAQPGRAARSRSRSSARRRRSWRRARRLRRRRGRRAAGAARPGALSARHHAVDPATAASDELMGRDDTVEQSWTRAGLESPESKPRPGVVKLFSAGAACFVPRPIDSGRALVLGRGSECDVVVEDARMSRRHAEVSLRRRRVAGQAISTAATAPSSTAARTWQSARPALPAGASATRCFLLCDDVRPMLAESDRAARRDRHRSGARAGVARRSSGAARSSAVLHITGETGSGKELAARRLPRRGPASRAARSWPSTAPPSPRRSPSACCSARGAAPTRAPTPTPTAICRRPTAARCSSTRSPS